MLKQTIYMFLILASVSVSVISYADAVPLDCTGDNCGAPTIPKNDESKGVTIPGNKGMPSAGQAGLAPGSPIEENSSPGTSSPGK